MLSPLRLGAVLQVRAGFGHLPFLVPQLSARISIQALEILRERLTFPSIDAPSSSRILFASVCHIANQRWQAIVFTPLHYRLFSAHYIISLPATSSASRVVFPSRGDQLLRVAPLLCYFNEVKCIIKEWNPSVVMTVLEPSEWPLLSAAESPHWGGVAAETLLTIAADPKHLRPHRRHRRPPHLGLGPDPSSARALHCARRWRVTWAANSGQPVDRVSSCRCGCSHDCSGRACLSNSSTPTTPEI